MEDLEQLFADWAQARSLGNAIYSIYKDHRDREETLQSRAEEIFKHKYGLDDQELIDMVTNIRKVVDNSIDNHKHLS